MASMNISIKKEAYDFLKSLKTKDKSFSDVILGFRKKQDLTRFLGVISNERAEEIKKNIEQQRTSSRKRLRRLHHDRT